MLHVTISNDLRIAARALAHAWRDGGAARDVVLIQSTHVAQWLRAWLARDWGVCADLDVLLPGAWMQALGGGDDVAWRRARLRWRLESAVPLDALPSDALARHRVLEQLADAFDTWQVQRSEVLAAWRRGEVADQRDRWLAQTWQALHDQGEGADRAQRMQEWIARLRRAPVPDVGRLTAFAVSHVPPMLLDALDALAVHHEVTMAIWSPSPQPWSEDRDARAITRERVRAMREALRAPTPRSIANPALHAHPGDDGHPLIAHLAGHARRWFSALDRPSVVQGWHALPFVTPEADGVLHRLQAGIVANALGERVHMSAEELAADASLRFHACSSERRELEVLREAIAAALRGGMACEQVLVLVADLPRYAPMIAAVFDRPLAGAQRPLPWRIDDRSLADSDPLCVAVLGVLALVDSRLPFGHVETLLRSQPVLLALDLEADSRDHVVALLRRCGVRWGADAQARAGLGDSTHGTWRAGVDRLRSGWWLGAIDHDDAPVANALAGDREIQARIAAWIDRLLALVQAAQHPLSIAEWVAWTRTALADLLTPDQGIDESLVAINEVLAEVQRHSQPPSASEPARVSVLIWREVLSTALASVSITRRPMAPSGITFAGLKPLRTIPADFIAVIGLDDETVPRRDRAPAWDIQARTPWRCGDRDARNEDRLLVLEALVAAGQHLHLSWIDRDPHTDAERGASLCLLAIREVIDQSIATDPGQAASALLTTVHPRHANGDTCDAQAHAVISALAAPRVPAQPWISAHSVCQESTMNVEATVEDVVTWLRDPAAAFLRHGLGVTVENEAPRIDDDDLLLLDGLDAWRVRNALQADPPPREAVLRADGVIPLGALGGIALVQQRDILAQLAERSGALSAAAPLRRRGQGWSVLARVQRDARGDLVVVHAAQAETAPRLLHAWVTAIICAEPVRLIGLDGEQRIRPPHDAEAACRDMVELALRCRRSAVPLPLTAGLHFHEHSDLNTARGQWRLDDDCPRECRATAAERVVWHQQHPVDHADFSSDVATLWRGFTREDAS